MLVKDSKIIPVSDIMIVNIDDLNEMPHSTASHLVLMCLLIMGGRVKWGCRPDKHAVL